MRRPDIPNTQEFENEAHCLSEHSPTGYVLRRMLEAESISIAQGHLIRKCAGFSKPVRSQRVG